MYAERETRQRRAEFHFFDSASTPTPKSFTPHSLLLRKSWKNSNPTAP